MKTADLKQNILDVIKVLVGSVAAAAAFRYITFPNDIVSSGITGIAQILNLLIGTPVGVMMLAMNVPLFVLAWRKMGRRFVLLSLLCLVAVSVFIDLMELWPFHVTSDPLLAAVYGGVLSGAGYGLVYTAGASGGGVDIPAWLLRRKNPALNLGTALLLLNAVTIVAFAAIFRKFDSCMYTIICLYIGNKVVDVILYGPVSARMCYIFSTRTTEVKTAITSQLGRGATLLHGQGAWSGQEREVILCAVKPQQITALRRIVQEQDPGAFFVVCDARGVYGSGFENINKED